MFLLAAGLEVLGRVVDEPVLREAAAWTVMGALWTVLVPIAIATAVVAYQNLVRRKKDRDSNAA